MPTEKLIANSQPYSIFRAIFWSGVSLVFLLVFVFMGWFNFRSNIIQDKEDFYSSYSHVIDRRITGKIDDLISDLRGVRGLFSASDVVDRDEFNEYIKSINLVERFGGAAVMLYVEKVQKSDLVKFSSEIKNDRSISSLGYPDFAVHPLSDKDEYYITKYIEPIFGREIGLGFDSGSDPERLRAIFTARDSGESVAAPVSKSPVTGRTAIHFYSAVYEKGSRLLTQEDRRSAFEGVVGIGLSIDYFFENMFDDLNDGFDIEIFDSAILDKEHLIFDYDNDGGGTLLVNELNNGIIYKTTLNFANHSWGLIVKFPENKNAAFNENISSPIILATGSILSILFAVLIFLILTSRTRAILLATKISEEFQKDKQKFEDLVKRSGDPIVILNTAGIIEFTNSAVSDISGHSTEEMLGHHFNDIGIILPEQIAMVNDQFSVLVRNEKVQPFEIVMKRKNGEEFIVEASPFFNPPDKVVVIFRDITKRVEFEKELKIKNEELAKLNQLMIGRELKMSELKKQLSEKDNK